MLFRPRLDGLTEAELWWEPVDDAWPLRRGDDGLYRYEWPPGSQGEALQPFTTLSWRLGHLLYSAMAKWALELEGDPDAEAKVFALAFPEIAAEVLTTADHWWERSTSNASSSTTAPRSAWSATYRAQPTTR